MTERIVLSAEDVEQLRAGAADEDRPIVDRVAAAYAVFMGGDSEGSVEAYTIGDMAELTGLHVHEVMLGLAGLAEHVI